MSSERKIESCRANGALSQGPVTPEGKRRSSRNGEKHGLYSSSILLNGESSEHYEEVRRHFLNHYQPVDQTEEYMIDEVVACHWRMNRIATMEAAALDQVLDTQKPTTDDAYETSDLPTRAALAFDTLNVKNSTLVTYRRFEAAYARQYDRAVRRLDSYLEKRKKWKTEPNPKNEHSPKLPDLES